MQDLARLVAQLLLLVGLARAVLDERASDRHDVEGDGATYATGAGKVTALPSKASAAAPSATARTCVGFGDALAASSDTAWYVETTSRRSPASVCSGWSTGIAAMVVQLGFATIPRGRSSRSSGLTSLTTSGTWGPSARRSSCR